MFVPMANMLIAVAISIAVPVTIAVITPLFIEPWMNKHPRIANAIWWALFSVSLFVPLLYKVFNIKGWSIDMLIFMAFWAILGAIYGYTTRSEL